MTGTIFTGARTRWLPLYEQLKGMVEETIGPFEEHPTTSAVLWKHSSAFAEISAKKDCIVVAFASDMLHDEWGASKVLQTSKNRVVHYFEVVDDTLFSQFIEHISQAYTLTQSSRPRRERVEKQTFATIDEYIALYSDDIQAILQQVRRTIREAAPGAQEKISWQMPTFYLHENLVHFAAMTNHIGLYPGASGVEMFTDRLVGYKTTKGAIQFPLSEPIPYDLIGEITRFRVKEANERHGR